MLVNVSAGSLGQPLVSLTEKDDLQVFQIIYKAVFDHNISSFYV
jgi:hypothetical protein